MTSSNRTGRVPQRMSHSALDSISTTRSLFAFAYFPITQLLFDTSSSQPLRLLEQTQLAARVSRSEASFFVRITYCIVLATETGLLPRPIAEVLWGTHALLLQLQFHCHFCHLTMMTDNNNSFSMVMTRLLMDASQQEHNGFSAVVWAINGVILCLIVGVSAFCWYQNGCIYYYAPYSTGMSASDLAYARVVLERQRLEEERRRGTPEQRSKRLHQKFNNEKIVMVCTEIVVCFDCVSHTHLFLMMIRRR